MSDPRFTVLTTPRFDRLMRSLSRRHADLVERFATVLEILGIDPYNRSRRHPIRKLESIPQGLGSTGCGSAGGDFAMSFMSARWSYTTAACVEKIRIDGRPAHAHGRDTPSLSQQRHPTLLMFAFVRFFWVLFCAAVSAALVPLRSAPRPHHAGLRLLPQARHGYCVPVL